MNKIAKLKLKKNSGFALLFTVLIAAIVLSVAIGISDIAYQEITLSSSAMDGSTAFFAADTGAECLLYWDINQNTLLNNPENSTSINCANQPIPFYVDDSSFSPAIVTDPTPFQINLNGGTNCAVMNIVKNTPIDTNNDLGTEIQSLGYNVPCGQILSGNPRMVQRAIQVTY